MNTASILRVATNAPLSRLFDYLAPTDTAVAPGCRVRVQFGRQTQIGLVMEVANQSELPISKLRSVTEVIDTSPLLAASDLWLVKFTSDYYHHPIGEVVAAALPALLRQGRPLQDVVQRLSLTKAGLQTEPAQLSKRAKRQAELLTLIQGFDDPTFTTLDEAMPGWRRLKKSLLDKALVVEITTIDSGRDKNSLTVAEQESGPPLNSDQSEALASIRRVDGFRTTLLDGVTGSGKTEVYLRLMADEIAAGRQVLVLVPEIGLTPQLVRRFERRLGFEPVVLHSGLSDSERLSAWRGAREGSAQLIVGTRSAIFVPMRTPGLIIVDEEHDASLKQQEGLRYSARDLAVARAKKLNVPVILGSATPSLETLQRCREGAYEIAELPIRAGNAVPPLMRLIDLTRFDAQDGLSEPVVKAITKNIDSNGQVLIYLNRRGFAPTLICGGCGVVAECTRCDSRMTVHATSGLLKCHHCGAQRNVDAVCGECGSHCRPLGHGTERLEDALQNRFPGESISRIDSDSTRLKGTMNKALAMATSGETRILVGTQMLSKGHHFPNLTLVVVINADQGLFSTDFRGAERLAQSLVQVAGRSGREERQGEVIIQTAFPEHPFWNEMFGGGYSKVASNALLEREKAVWPPFSRIALVRASATRREDAHEFLQHALKLTQQAAIADVRVLGPVGAPMERKAGRYRAQLLLQSRDRHSLHRLLAILRHSLEGDKAARRVRWSLDVDPIELF
ncbi:MAG: primosomal protein N' [Woeseia sp.]|jgi:primosomal protein N' (replication factor Y) (superfamily II helicase)|nr:primosomal protein N' [Woeseia sp.]